MIGKLRGLQVLVQFLVLMVAGAQQSPLCTLHADNWRELHYVRASSDYDSDIRRGSKLVIITLSKFKATRLHENISAEPACSAVL